MHRELLAITVENVRQRVSEGDCPVTPAYSVEQLEHALLALAARAHPSGLAGAVEVARDEGAKSLLARRVRSALVEAYFEGWERGDCREEYDAQEAIKWAEREVVILGLAALAPTAGEGV